MIARTLLLCLALWPTLAAAATVGCDQPNPLRFSLIPRTDVGKQLERYRPFLQYLERTLGRRIEVVRPTSYRTVIEGLVAGNIDLASMGAASYAMAKSRDATIIPFATWTMKEGTFVKSGAHLYHSLLIVPRDSAVGHPADLKGSSVSLTDPASTSGAVVPREEFGSLVGARFEDYFRLVTYSGSHDRSIEAVRKGYADAAFVASEHLDEAIRQRLVDARDFRVVWTSRPIPHDPFVFRGKLCPELRERIRTAFLADAPEIQSMMAEIKGERFIAVSEADYREIERLFHP